MNIRSLWPWLLVGVVIASASANVTMYMGLTSPGRDTAPSPGVDPAVISAYHLAPGSMDARCPTLDQLGLTQTQRDQIRKCSLASLDLRTDLAIKVGEASAELDELLSRDAVDNPRVLEVADRIADLRSRQYRSWVDSILIVRAVLTPEQQRQLRTIESD